MNRGPVDHLADDVLFRLSQGLDDAGAPEHLSVCAQCRERLEGLRAMQEELMKLSLPPEEGEAADCPPPLAWALLVTQGLEAERDKMLAHAAQCGRCAALLRAAHEEDEPEAAPVIPMPAPATVRRRPVWHWWSAAAAVLALLFVPAWYWLLRDDPATLMAKAYTEARPFLPRVPGALHAPLAQVRAGDPALNRPSLIRAAGLLTSHRNDQRYTVWKGAYELLTLRTDDAIETLRQARSSSSDGQAALLLAVALYQRGTANSRREDLLEALDLQAAAMRNANPPLEAGFNLALTYEALDMKEQAVNAWREYLRRDAASPWSAEARQRLNVLEEQLKNRQGAQHRLRADPAGFLRDGGTPELLLPAAWMEWYPAQKQDLLRLLASRMTEEHGDSLLAGVLAAPFSPVAAGLLSDAIRANRSGARESILQGERFAEQAVREALRAGNEALALRARAEYLYALHLEYRSQPCLREARQLAADLEQTRYAWLKAQVRLESANCLAMTNEYGAAIQAAADARAAAVHARLPELEMRAAGLESGFRVQAGDLSGVLSADGELLSRYWTAPFVPNRAQQFFSNAVRGAEALGFDQAAYEMARARFEAMAHLGTSPLQARGRAHLALLAAKVGNSAEAQRQMQDSISLFAELGNTAGAMRRDAEVDLVHARFLLRIPEPGENAVASLQGVIESPPTADSALRASALAASMRPAESGAYVDRAVEHHQTRLKDLRGWARHQAIEQSSPLYRWKAALLVGENRWQEALAAWLKRSGRTTAPANAMVFLTTGEGVARWWIRGQDVSWRQLSLREPELRRSVAALRRLAADPASSPQAIEQLALRLRNDLLEGWSGHGVLRVAADEAFDGLPWMLLSGEGSVSLERSLRFQPDAPVALRGVTALAPAASARFAALYPHLPDAIAESGEVMAKFGEARLFRGHDATPAVMRPWGNALHFSGHASPAGLVLAGEDGFTLYGAADVARTDWSGMDLVCLSACSTGVRGRVNRGSQSMADAFLAGGAGAAIASLWNVDAAATRALMRLLYERLDAGDAAADALRHAALSVKENPAFRHPYYWAAFQTYY